MFLDDFQDLTELKRRINWIWEKKKCFQLVCAFLDFSQIVTLGLCSKSLYDIFVNKGFDYSNLLIYEQSRYRISAKLSKHLVPLESKEENNVRANFESLPQVFSNSGLGTFISSTTEYDTHKGTFRPLSKAQAQRLHVGGTSSEFMGHDWFKCSKKAQRQWLSRICGLKVLWVDIDVNGDKGIEPWSLARILENNQSTLKSIRIYWRSGFVKDLCRLCWNSNYIFQKSLNHKITTPSVYLFQDHFKVSKEEKENFFQNQSIENNNNYNKNNYSSILFLRDHDYHHKDLHSEEHYNKEHHLEENHHGEHHREEREYPEKSMNQSRRLKRHIDISKRVIRPHITMSRSTIDSKNFVRKAPEKSMSFQDDNIYDNISKKASRIRLKSLQFFNTRGEALKVDYNNYLSKDMSSSKIYFSQAEEISLQFENQEAVEFFSHCRFPQCIKLLIEDMNSAHDEFLKKDIRKENKIKLKNKIYSHDKQPQFINHTNYLNFWFEILESTKKLREAHFFLIGNKSHFVFHQLQKLYNLILKNNMNSLEAFSCRSSTITSQELLLISAEINAQNFFENKEIISIENFPKLIEVHCEFAPIDLSNFALNVLKVLPKIVWKCKEIIIGSSNQYNNKSFLYLPLSHIKEDYDEELLKVCTCIPNGFFIPIDPMSIALLQKSILKSLEYDLEHLIVESVTEEFAATFTKVKKSNSSIHYSVLNNITTALQDDEEDELGSGQNSVVKFPCITRLSIQWCRNQEGVVVNSDMHSQDRRIISVLKNCRLGTSGKMQNPEARSKLRLQVLVQDICSPNIIAVLPKFQYVLNGFNTRMFELIINYPAARKQLRGLSGSLKSILHSIKYIHQNVLPWCRPPLKSIEVIIPHAVIRCFASVSQLLQPLSYHSKVTEIRVYARLLPQYLTPDELYSDRSPEGELLREILRIDGFHRDTVAEAEIRGLYSTSMFVFTRPQGRRSRWRQLRLSTLFAVSKKLELSMDSQEEAA